MMCRSTYSTQTVNGISLRVVRKFTAVEMDAKNEKMMKGLLLLFIVCASCGQPQTNPPQDAFSREHNGLSESQIKELVTSKVPTGGFGLFPVMIKSPCTIKRPL
jgi:hypothetical protein